MYQALTTLQVGATGFEAADKIAVTADEDWSCEFCQGWRAANALQRGGSECLDVTQLDADLRRVISVWAGLPETIQRAVVVLIGTV
ncbi:MAG: hypothetical protein WBL72_03055 [Thermoguttaceae bacterium]